ncbi:Spermidine/putrescine import ATP-binding protein PotA [bacterium HR32]|nr:Spermidine/putrescine import ATP-binding protein PotA [bacterium HR32]
MASVQLAEVTKRFGSVAAVRRLTLEVRDGELLTLLGPSGCGKTTTLRLVAGFLAPEEGRIRFGGRDVTTLPPEHRNVGIVFQNYALFPHMTVAQNVAFGLRCAGGPPRRSGLGWGRSSSAFNCRVWSNATPTNYPADNSSAWPWRGPS